MTHRFRFYRRSARSTVAGISAATAWIRETAERHELVEDIAFRLDLCANELFDNVAEHAYGGVEGEIGIELFLDRDGATLTVVDDASAFDPVSRPEAPAPRSLEEATVGGLGLKLIRRFADEIDYERCGSQNRVTVRLGTRRLSARRSERRSKPPEHFPVMRADGSTITEDARCTQDRRGFAALDRTSLFHGASEREVQQIVARCELRHCESREVLFAAGEHHRCVLLALEGRLEIHLDAPDSMMYAELGPGECVGELSVSDGAPISAWVIAASPCTLLVIPEPVFVDLVLAVPAIARNLVVILSERMRKSNVQLVARARAAMEFEALQRELDIARGIQFSMLPPPALFPSHPRLDGCGFMRAARQVGGDFYDGFTLTDGRAFIAIGDVCNKGMPAAMFMVRTLTVLRSEAISIQKDAARHLKRLAERCNDILNESNEAQQFVTLFCAIVDPERGIMHYVNAGHCPPVLRLPGAAPRFLNLPRNPLVGIVPGLRFHVGSVELPAQSLLVLYTDGVTEAEAASGAMFDDERLLSTVAALPGTDVSECVNAVVAAVDGFSAGHPQSDDVTLLAVALG